VKRIICIGNRFHERDSAGPRVHDRLAAAGLPPGLELVDGGLAGLDLGRLVKGAERVVFVDATVGFAPAPGTRAVVVLSSEEVAAEAAPHFDHAAGLPYLLRALPAILEEPPPPIEVVGVEGALDEALLDQAAATALRLALRPRRTGAGGEA
jgi:hydrogenase maturation protease